MVKKFKFLYPLFVAISPAVFLWSRNFGEVPIREVIPALVVLVIFGGLVLTAFWFLFRDPEKAALMASVFLIPILFFDYIYNIFFFNSFLQLRWRWALIILGIILIFAFHVLNKTKKKLLVLNQVFLTTVGVFVLISFFQVGWNYLLHYRNEMPNRIEVMTNGDITKLRDIYYIILDGYSSPGVIKEVMGFEKVDKFVNFLENRGFFVAQQSQSNYPATIFSLPSSLNMRFLDRPDLHKKHFQIAEDHFLKDFLKSYGYRYLHFGADAFTFFNRYADENINIGMFSPYQMAIWNSTIFKQVENFTGITHTGLAERFGFLNESLLEWKRVRLQLGELVKVPEIKDGPVFVFAHFLLPQGPNVFNADGSFMSEDEIARKTQIEKYIDQVAYINKEIEIVVDNLLKQSDSEPIIILQGDHGFAFGVLAANEPELLDELTFKPGQKEELIIPNVNYSFPILNAYYLPDGGNNLLYDSISPVNTFRLILNNYFDQDLELLDDIRYVIDPNDPSQFIPVEDLRLDR